MQNGSRRITIGCNRSRHTRLLYISLCGARVLLGWLFVCFSQNRCSLLTNAPQPCFWQGLFAAVAMTSWNTGQRYQTLRSDTGCSHRHTTGSHKHNTQQIGSVGTIPSDIQSSTTSGVQKIRLPCQAAAAVALAFSSLSCSRIRSRHLRSVTPKPCSCRHFLCAVIGAILCLLALRKSFRVTRGFRPMKEAGAVYVLPSLPQVTVFPSFACMMLPQDSQRIAAKCSSFTEWVNHFPSILSRIDFVR
jgi:hypothetical protein